MICQSYFISLHHLYHRLNIFTNCSSVSRWISNYSRTSHYFLHNLQVTFYIQLRVTIYCTNYELPFTYELRVTIYCTSYEKLFTCESRVTDY